MKQFEHWASHEDMAKMIDSWSDEMKREALEYLMNWNSERMVAEFFNAKSA